MSFFTPQHFKVFNKRVGTKYDKTNTVDTTAYDQLADVYKLVDQWAEGLKKALFPNGYVKVIKN